MRAARALVELREAGELSDLDLHFGRAVARWSRGCELTALAAAWLSRAAARGHVCLDLASASAELAELGFLRCPADEWLPRLGESPAVGEPGEFKPLVLAGTRLYLFRYWKEERGVAELLRARAAAGTEVEETRARAALDRLFPRSRETSAGDADGQKLAAAVALTKRLCVLSGGPGTGKTTTVAKLLALLTDQEGPLRIALAASTGKAAARLQEALRARAPELGLPVELEAVTVHRLLGAVPGRPSYRHDASNPLPYDVVVVDEVSMVDLGLMARLTAAVAPSARLLLLGDRDQLASVQAGSVLSDLCGPGPEGHRYSRAFAEKLRRLTGESPEGAEDVHPGSLADCLAFLRRSYRFRAKSGIGDLCGAVNRGDARAVLELLRGSVRGGLVAERELSWREPPPPEGLTEGIEDAALRAFGPVFEAPDATEAFRRFDAFRILCAHREGPFGAVAVNRAVEKVLAKNGRAARREWYRGRPLLITRNDHALRLSNGDVGLVLPDPESGGALRAFFPPSSEGGEFRRLPLLRLPPHETCYAMTVHKSQGSEFDRVLLLLGDRASRVLTRELLYTGASRARTALEVWASEEALVAAVTQRVSRASGLAEALWGEDG